MSDPYDIFGNGDGDEEEENTGNVRDPSCGVLTWHEGTEEALYQYVVNGLTDNNIDAKVKRRKILQLVDRFCLERHWMMHVGDKKGLHLEAFVAQAISQHLRDKPTEPFILVEIGTYCGYSLIRMAEILLDAYHASEITPKFHCFTVDVSKVHVAVAQKMIALAELSPYVSFIMLENPTTIGNELTTKLVEAMEASNLIPTIHFLFLDHEKDLYYSDLIQLERAKLIRAGCHVAADNVLFFQLDQYRSHMEARQAEGIVTTKLVQGTLEYVNKSTAHESAHRDLTDGMGKY